jgi:hypothetical protein
VTVVAQIVQALLHLINGLTRFDDRLLQRPVFGGGHTSSPAPIADSAPSA